MSSVASGDTTVGFIRRLVRELCASPGEQQLTTAYIDETLNNFYANDFPYGIKLDQMRDVYTFYTQPYTDRYPLDVNYNQGVRGPAYVDGIQAFYLKDREEFLRTWPKWPTLFTQFSSATNVFNFTVPGPFLSGEVTIGGTDSTGTTFTISDNGYGVLQSIVSNPVVSIPAQDTNPALPGMYNINTQNPGLKNPTNIGTVNYVTGQIAFTLPNSLFPGTTLNVKVSQYQTGRPFSLLFWNNQFTVRPVPKAIHKITVETYLTPVQFMSSTNNPILNQWSFYLGYGTACEIVRRRQDTSSLQNLMEGMKRQEALVLERQATEEIGSRNSTIFSSSVPQQNVNGYMNNWWY